MPEQIPQVELCSLILQDLLGAVDLARLKQMRRERLYLFYACAS